MSPPAHWALVVPVKRLAIAKTRLAALAGPLRPELALAFAADTVRAALACSCVSGVVVVSDDAVARPELAALGALVVPDVPDAGLNPALAYGASRAAEAHPGAGVGALSADLPALRPADLGAALVAAAAFPRSLVADAAGAGTTLLAARAPADLRPAFGRGSCAAHLAGGAVELAGAASLRRDVDTEADLRAALHLGVGPRTGAVAARLPLGSPAVQATVRSYNGTTRSGTVLLDDGLELPYDEAAFAAGGRVRLLRQGQRVRVRLSDDGARVVFLTLATLPDP